MGRWCRRAAGLVAMGARAASAGAEPADRCSAIGVLVVIGEPGSGGTPHRRAAAEEIHREQLSGAVAVAWLGGSGCRAQ